MMNSSTDTSQIQQLVYDSETRFFCAMAQFAVNIVWSYKNTDIETSHFPPRMTCAITFINFLQLQTYITEKQFSLSCPSFLCWIWIYK